MIKSGEAFALMTLVLFAAFVVITYYISKRGKEWYMRPIEALEVIDESIGRSAEMGRPVMCLPGMSGLGNMLTLAGLSICGEVNERAARIGVTPVNLVSAADTLMVMEAMVKNAFVSAEKGELYQPGKYVYWTGSEQFAYATYVMGTIMKEKPAAIIFVGSFLSDIMMNTETGKRVGAIEVGGCTDTTAMATMAMVCDSILIGEEIYAAAAVITKDKALAGSIAGQDWAFIVTLALMTIGVALGLAGIKLLSDLMVL